MKKVILWVAVAAALTAAGVLPAAD